MKDLIIVGQGLAAHVLAHTFRKNQLSFTVIGSPALSKSSQVAAGIWNPIVFKRMTSSWLAHLTIPFLSEFYHECEKELQTDFITQRKLIKPFVQEQEKQLWIKKSKNELSMFIDETVFEKNNRELNNCILKEYGIVKQAGNLDIASFLEASRMYFKENCIFEKFDHDSLIIGDNKVQYKDTLARHIVFCEGHLISNNPYFSWIPMKPVKGEVLTFTANELFIQNTVLNKNGFIIDIGNNTFKAGATYEWNDLSETPTEKGKRELEAKISQMISCNYETKAHEAGIRPSTIDRRPVIGKHPKHPNMFVFNGLGTKGVMLAPYFANNFVLFYHQKQELNPETDVKRFYHLFNHEKQ